MNHEIAIRKLNLLRDVMVVSKDSDTDKAFNEAIKALSQPNVVLCGDCENFIVSTENPNVGTCNIGVGEGLHLHSVNWFCANGERKDKEE